VPNFVVWLGLILFNHLFVIGTGGDWMEFYRFIVPIIPFLVILTTCFSFRMINAVLKKLDGSNSVVKAFPNVAIGVLFLFMIATNSSQRDNYGTQDFHNCSEKINRSIIRSLVMDHSQLDAKLILLNCAGKRDWEGAMPFILDELPKLYESLGQNITVATYQMGFFPYYVKKINPTMNIEFIDTFGLADNNVALLQGPRKRYGLSDGNRIVDILAGRSGRLSEYILSRHPNMIYVLNATSTRKMAMTDLGWTTSWDRPGAVIFTKNGRKTKVP
jgi:hypothetical protein